MTEPMPMSLPDQARLAADILDALNTRLECPTNGHWRPSELRGEADHIEAEEREAAERQNQTASLGQALEIIYRPFANAETPHFVLAKALIEDGWHKGDLA